MYGSEYLLDIRVELHGELGKGPTGTCIRENRSVVNDDFATNPATSPWREPTLWLPRFSRISPLRRGGNVIGAFTLYATEPKAFGPEQVGLLESLSADISYALDDLDKEQLCIRAEESLRQSERHYRLLFDTMLQGVVCRDADSTILSVNPSAKKILGKTLDVFLGISPACQENFTIRVDDMLFPSHEHPAMIALQTGKEVHDVVTGVYNPQEKCYRWINIDAIPIPLLPGEDKPGQVYTLFYDITKHKQANEALQRAKDELELKIIGSRFPEYVVIPTKQHEALFYFIKGVLFPFSFTH